MSRPIKPPRPYPADWRTNTLEARGWAEPLTETHHAWMAWVLAGGAIALAGIYGFIGWALRQPGGDL